MGYPGNRTMTELQELISRGRFIFSNAPKRLKVYELVNGKNSTKDIARNTRRSLSAVIQDLEKIRDVGIIREKKNNDVILKKENATIYEKVPLIKHVPLNYFEPISKMRTLVTQERIKKMANPSQQKTHVPNENEILDICKNHEDQINEFKAPGVTVDKITREIAGFLHNKGGGIIFYGVDDSGTIIGSDLGRHDLDQRVQNSIRNTISPQPNVQIVERNVLGSQIVLVVVPSWDKKAIYQYTKDGNYYIRKGTNIFALRPDELAKLHKGEYVV